MIKYKVTKTVVNNKGEIIALVIQGKEKDLGGLSSEVIEKPIPIDVLKKMNNGNGFHNHQCDINRSGLSGRGNFSFADLQMIVFDNVTNSYSPIGNKIELVKRYVQDNQNVGFDVKFEDGHVKAYTYANVMALCKWFKPVNFMISTTKNNRAFIKGHNFKIDDLPVQVIGDESKAKKTRSSARDAGGKKFGTTLESGFDILDVYDLIYKYKGQVIKLPNEKYVSATPSGNVKLDEFTPYGIGEVASPKLMFNATKLNVNAGFKKVGYVPVTINNATTNITTYIFRSKSLFLAGENYVRTFGIAVPAETEKELITALGKSLAIEKITDTTITQPLGQVIDAKNLSFYKVNSDRLELISSKKRESSLMSASQLAELCKQQYSLKLISKYAGPRSGVMKEVKESLGNIQLNQQAGRQPFGIFAMMNPNVLQYLESVGFDIYTGAYTKMGIPEGTNEDGGTDSVGTKVEIVYVLKGYDAGKINVAKLKQAYSVQDSKVITPEVANVIAQIEAVSDPVEKYKLANKIYKDAEEKLGKIAEMFWRHNAAMYILGNKRSVHTKDAGDWEPIATKAKSSVAYENKAVSGLVVKLTGVTLG